MTVPRPASDHALTVPQQRWLWKARLDHVVDADTISCIVDRGYNDFSKIPIRLTECWAQERFTERGKLATAFVKQWFADNTDPKSEWPLTLQTLKDDTIPKDATDKYSRWTAKLWARKTGRLLNVDLIAAGHATKTRSG